MKPFNALIEQNIPVNWKTLWIGWRGPNGYSRLITLEDVSTYASALIEFENNSDDEVLYLAGVGQGEEDKTDELLRNLANENKVDDSLEHRKWRWVLLTSIFDALTDDPLYGTMELTEFWEKWGNPIDSPMRDFYKDESDPKILYSEEKYKNLRSDIQEWIQKEKRLLTHNEV